jgi:hypothetical protein
LAICHSEVLFGELTEKQDGHGTIAEIGILEDRRVEAGIAYRIGQDAALLSVKRREA